MSSFSIRGFVSINWYYLNLIIILPLGLCFIMLVIHCIVMANRSSNRLNKHVDTFEENEKPLI